MLKSRIIKDILEKIELYQPLVIEDGERADTIAYDYYNDSELYWLVYMANSIVDPYYDWPMNQAEFKSYIIKKYGRVDLAMQKILFWSNPDFDYYMTNESKALLPSSEIQGWIEPVYAYTYENELNENKRNIHLIDKIFVPQIISEMNKIYG